MRTFGVSDDDDDDVEGDDESDDGGGSVAHLHARRRRGLDDCSSRLAIDHAGRSSSGPRSPQFLLQDPGQADAVVFATITGCVWAIFKLAEMVIWFEGRGAHLRARSTPPGPTFNLIAIIVIVSAGGGVKGAIIGQTIGTTLATLICVALIWKSFQVGLLVRRAEGDPQARRDPGAHRLLDVGGPERRLVHPLPVPRPQGHRPLHLASRTGFMVAFLPQGFRMALRPIRKTACYEAFIDASTGCGGQRPDARLLLAYSP